LITFRLICSDSDHNRLTDQSVWSRSLARGKSASFCRKMQILFVGRQRGFERAVIQFMGRWRRRSGRDVPETIQGKWFVIINSEDYVCRRASLKTTSKGALWRLLTWTNDDQQRRWVSPAPSLWFHDNFPSEFLALGQADWPVCWARHFLQAMFSSRSLPYFLWPKSHMCQCTPWPSSLVCACFLLAHVHLWVQQN
jgi:hypothetical protein